MCLIHLAQERISEFEERWIEVIQAEANRIKRLKKHNQSLSDCGTISNVGYQKKRRERKYSRTVT